LADVELGPQVYLPCGKARLKSWAMSAPGPLFRPHDRLVKITVAGRDFSVPDNNVLLRALQYLAPEGIAYGRFCWNEDCQYCRVSYDLGEGTPLRTAISCKLMVQEGMRLVEVAQEIRYCLRDLNLPSRENENPGRARPLV
jgi:hypothetical protein